METEERKDWAVRAADKWQDKVFGPQPKRWYNSWWFVLIVCVLALAVGVAIGLLIGNCGWSDRWSGVNL